jgi:NDP-sugar pyrophosphorylase family protein
LREVTGDLLPKALIEVAGRPFVDLKLEELGRQGFREVVLLTGFGGDQIAAHVGDGGRYGLAVRVHEDGGTPLGTGGAVAAALPSLGSTFWVTYGDTLLDLVPATAEALFLQHDQEWDGLMTVLHNRDRWGRSNARVDGDRIAAYAKDPTPVGAEHIDYGMVLVRDAVFAGRAGGVFDFADVLTPLAARGRLGAFTVERRFLEIGTPESLAEVRDLVGGSPDPSTEATP